MTASTTPTQLRLADAIAGQCTPVDDATVKQWRRDGWWENRTIRSILTETASRHPNRLALVGRRSDGTRPTRTYAELDASAHRAANALASLGVAHGDAVVVMLPNWIEYAEIVLGINEIGAMYAGIPVAYGPLQAAPILRRSRAKVLVVPRRWRSNENLELARQLRRDIPTLQHVVVLDDEGSGLGECEHQWSQLLWAPEHSVPAPRPDQLCYLGFTSGTTGEPKGAMHTHETLIYSARLQAAHLGYSTYGDPMVQLVASPVGHHTGFEWGIVFTILIAGTAVHVDRWDPSWGLEVVREEGITAFFGAPTFLQDMMRTDLADGSGSSLACVVVAGAPIPRNLAKDAARALGAFISPAWGMTECSIITASSPHEDPDVLRTDGSVFAGSELRVVDPDGRDVPVGTEGDLWIRGPALALGYYDRPDATANAYRQGLWFATGDRASLDDHGRLIVRGRTKDIVIRGGENIPVTDIESVLFDHPDVVNVAVIGVPDDRLGERICAVIVQKPDTTPLGIDDVAAFLLSSGLSKHYLPELVHHLDELPMTPSGKIQKFRLREVVA
jgi:cyclohexanecarboxylate-CoA ligase